MWNQCHQLSIYSNIEKFTFQIYLYKFRCMLEDQFELDSYCQNIIKTITLRTKSIQLVKELHLQPLQCAHTARYMVACNVQLMGVAHSYIVIIIVSYLQLATILHRCYIVGSWGELEAYRHAIAKRCACIYYNMNCIRVMCNESGSGEDLSCIK